MRKIFGLKRPCVLDRVGLGRHIALHCAPLVGQERLRVEGVGLHLLLAEAEVVHHPLEVRSQALLGNEQRQLLQVLEFLDALVGMRQQHLRILLEDRGDDQGRDVLRDRVERLQRVGAHVEFDPAGDQLQAVVHVRPARQDGDVEAVLLVGAVGHRLIEAAVLGLRHPVGGKSDLVELLGLRVADREPACRENRQWESHRFPPVMSCQTARALNTRTVAAQNRAEPLPASLRPRTIRRLSPIIRRALTIGVRSPPSPAPFDRPARFRPPPGGPPLFSLTPPARRLSNGGAPVCS